MAVGDKDPRLIQYFKWATITITGITAVGGALAFVIVLLVRWAATPIVKTEVNELKKEMLVEIAAANSQIAATNNKIDLVAAGMKYTESDPRRRQILNYVNKVKANQPTVATPPVSDKPQ